MTLLALPLRQIQNVTTSYRLQPFYLRTAIIHPSPDLRQQPPHLFHFTLTPPQSPVLSNLSNHAITPVLTVLQWFPVSLKTKVNVLTIASKALQNLVSS